MRKQAHMRHSSTGKHPMNDTAAKRPQNGYLALLAAVLLCVASSIFMMNFVPDDSYISFRYAENLSAGHGLRFNAIEEPVEGYSNLLWIVLCAVMCQSRTFWRLTEVK